MGECGPRLETGEPIKKEPERSVAKMNVTELTVPELLLLHTQIGDELRKRGVTRMG